MKAKSRAISLGQLAEQFSLELTAGDPEALVIGVCALDHGQPQHLAFAEQAAKKTIENSQAGVVVTSRQLSELVAGACLVADNPKLAFARIARLFEPNKNSGVIHPTAVVDASAHIGEHVTIGAHVVVGAESIIGDHSYIGPNAVIGAHVKIGEQGYIGPNATVEDNVRMGLRGRIEAGAAIGARGFGLVHNGQGWEAIPQLGGVLLGDDVEVGAATTIDRGALGDTIIGDNVRIDNQIQIGHNCRIGAHTVIAGSAGIAGSCDIGANCMIGGGVGIGDHLTIVDNVIITAATQVPHSIEQPGVWSSTFRAMPANQWRKLLARFRRLGRLNQRVKRIEKVIADRRDGDFE